jgi:hypothetical protein
MSGPQSGHVWPNPIPQWLSPGPNISGPQAGFQGGWLDISGPRPRHVRVSDTPMTRFPWGTIKGPPRLSSTVEHSFHIANTLRHSLELPASLLQASFKFNRPMRDLSLTLEWPTRSSSQALHRRSPCVRYSWGFVPLDGLGCPGVTKVVVDPGMFVLSSPLWGFGSRSQTKSGWSFRVD